MGGYGVFLGLHILLLEKPKMLPRQLHHLELFKGSRSICRSLSLILALHHAPGSLL